jgi:hypothetical protein
MALHLLVDHRGGCEGWNWIELMLFQVQIRHDSMSRDFKLDCYNAYV